MKEIKQVDEKFKRIEIEEIGYNVEKKGKKGLNGVEMI